MKPQVISFRCVLKSSTGRLISTTFNRDVLTEAPEGEAVALPALAKRLRNLRKGEKRLIRLDAAEAYGLYDLSLVLRLPRRQLPGDGNLRVGDQVQLVAGKEERVFRVTEELGSELMLDANHPLAGQDLVFDIQVLEAREATDEDLRDVGGSEAPKYLH